MEPENIWHYLLVVADLSLLDGPEAVFAGNIRPIFISCRKATTKGLVQMRNYKS